MITNNYARKLIWGIGFALFCVCLVGVYHCLLSRRNKVFVTCNGNKTEFFSTADFSIFFIMAFLASIRLNVGSDFYNYFVRFNNVTKDMSLLKLISEMDGYRVLSYLIKQITDYQYAIFIVVAVCLYGYLFHIIKNEVEDRASALSCYLFMGFFANSLNIIKQCIAMMFIMCFYNSLSKKLFFRAAVFAFFAFLFHFSALFAVAIMVVMHFVKIKPSRNLLIISILVGLLLALFLPQLVSILIKIMPSASGYQVYVNWRRNGQFRLIIAVAVMSLMYGFLLYHIIKNKDSIRKTNERRYYEISFLILGLCINIASIRIWVVQRIALYFYQFIILIIPTMFQGIEPNRRKRLKVLIYTVMVIYLVFCGIFNGENEYYSYNTVFSGEAPVYDAVFNKQFR